MTADQSWDKHAHPLQQITIRLQGTRHSEKEAGIDQLETVLARLKAGDSTGHDYDDDFGYAFDYIAASPGPHFSMDHTGMGETGPLMSVVCLLPSRAGPSLHPRFTVVRIATGFGGDVKRPRNFEERCMNFEHTGGHCTAADALDRRVAKRYGFAKRDRSDESFCRDRRQAWFAVIGALGRCEVVQ